jgi:hypothetical protein
MKYLVGLPGPHLGESPHHVKNSKNFINTVETLWLTTYDIHVSYSVSLFTNVLNGDALQLLSQQFNEDNVRLFHHPPSFTIHILIFLFQQPVLETNGGSHHGFTACSRIAKFFTEDFKDGVLSGAVYKASCWLHYTDETFVVWPHGF